MAFGEANCVQNGGAIKSEAVVRQVLYLMLIPVLAALDQSLRPTRKNQDIEVPIRILRWLHSLK